MNTRNLRYASLLLTAALSNTASAMEEKKPVKFSGNENWQSLESLSATTELRLPVEFVDSDKLELHLSAKKVLVATTGFGGATQYLHVQQLAQKHSPRLTARAARSSHNSSPCPSPCDSPRTVLYDAFNGNEPSSFITAFTTGTGSHIATGRSDGLVNIIDRKNHFNHQTVQFPETVNALAFDPTMRYLMACCTDLGKVFVYSFTQADAPRLTLHNITMPLPEVNDLFDIAHTTQCVELPAIAKELLQEYEKHNVAQ